MDAEPSQRALQPARCLAGTGEVTSLHAITEDQCDFIGNDILEDVAGAVAVDLFLAVADLHPLEHGPHDVALYDDTDELSCAVDHRKTTEAQLAELADSVYQRFVGIESYRLGVHALPHGNVRLTGRQRLDQVLDADDAHDIAVLKHRCAEMRLARNTSRNSAMVASGETVNTFRLMASSTLSSYVSS